MAKIYLDASETFTIGTGSKGDVIGQTGGTEKVLLSGTATATVDGNIERVELTGNAAAYTYKITGNVITVLSAGVAVATLTNNATQTLAFADGSAALTVTGLNAATLGGAALTSTTGAAVVPTLVTTDKSTVAVVTAAALTIATSAASATESTVTTTTADFTVTLSAVQTAAVTVAYNTSDGTGAGAAISTSDYTTTSGTLSIAAGATTGKISVPIVDNLIFDGTATNTSGIETFTLTLSAPSTGTLTNTTATGTITDNEVNDLPVNTVPTGAAVILSQTQALAGISTKDANNTTVTTVITAANGLLTNASSGGIAAAANKATITMTGSITDINGALGTLTYLSDRTAAGIDSVTVTTTDTLGGVDTDVFTVDVKSGFVFTGVSSANVVDTFVGTSANESFVGVGKGGNTGAASGVGATFFTGADTLNGSTGTDTLTLTQFDTGTLAGTLNASGIEAVNITTSTFSEAIAVTIGGATDFNSAITSLSLKDGNATTTTNDSLTLTAWPNANTITLNSSLTALNLTGSATGLTETVVLAGGVTVAAYNAAVAAPVVTTLNIQSNGSSLNKITAFGGTGAGLVVALDGTVNVSGSAAFTTTLGNWGSVLKIDGSAATGALTISAAANGAVTGAVLTLTGGSGNDVLTGDSDGKSTITGGAGNDTLTGGSLADSLLGGAGDDTLNGGVGTADTLTGGTGKDTYSINQSGDTVVLVAGDTGTVAAGTADVINGLVEGAKINLSGYDTSTFATTFIANANLATATVGASATLRDIYINSTNKSIVIEMDATGTTTQEISIGVASSATIANVGGVLTFGAVPMTAYVSGSEIVIEGQSPNAGTTVSATLATSPPQSGVTGSLSNVPGATTSFANLNISKLTGATGTVITGSSLSNTIVGSSMVDSITPGLGNDTMTGGAGADRFIYNGTAASGTYTDALATTAGMDRITDFLAVTDKIVLINGTTSVGAVTAVAVATAADVAAVLTAIANSVAASSATVAQVGLVTVAAGAMTGTYLLVNDLVQAAAATDTLINITGVSGTVVVGDFIFA